VRGSMSLSPGKNGTAPLSATVVICTHNRPILLERCLRAVQQIEYPDFSIVVIDSAPNSYDARILAARYGASYGVSPIKGLSRARNLGTRSASGDIVAYLDDDMVPHVRWLRSLVDEFADRDVVAVTGPVLPSNLENSTEDELQAALGTVPWGPNRFQLDQSNPQWFERANFGGIGDGNFALRRKVFDLLPGFDERLGRGATLSGGEEHYAYFMLLQIGFRIAYAPDAIVFHPNSPMTQQYRRKFVAESVAYAAFLMWRHPSQLSRIARYFGGGMLRVKRTWRTTAKHEISSFSRYEMLVGALDGFSLFLRSLCESEVPLRETVLPPLDCCNVTGRSRAKPFWKVSDGVKW
jgi:GT2 family glycosyltransferase